MASASKDSKGWRVLFVDANGQRRQLRPGKVNKATAEQIGRHIDSIVGTIASRGTMERQTALWLGEIGDKLHAKLAKAGLIESRVKVEPQAEPSVIRLKSFLDDHLSHGRTRTGKPAAENTLANWRSTIKYLVRVFGADKPIKEITAEDAHQFRVWLDKRLIKQNTSGRRGQPMAENAKRKHVANCKLFFNAAKRRGLVDSNPFEHLVSGSEANRNRDHYITPKDAKRILLACPDGQWRLLFGLWRLAGLRKMEVFNLTWGDVLWNEGKLRVRIPKTQHHTGCELRYVPIRDIRVFLEEAFQAALPTGQHSLPAETPIITRFATTNTNLDKPLKLIIEKAGLVPWPKLFQNLRSSCETQWLKDGERADLVANWIGHSVKVQNENYVQHTAEDIDAFNEKQPFSFEDSEQVPPPDISKQSSKGGTHSGTVEPRIAKNRNERDSENTGKSKKASVFVTPKYPEQESNLQPAA